MKKDNFLTQLNELAAEITRNEVAAGDCPCDPCICEYYDSCDKLLSLLFKRMIATREKDRRFLYPETYKLIDRLF